MTTIRIYDACLKSLTEILADIPEGSDVPVFTTSCVTAAPTFDAHGPTVQGLKLRHTILSFDDLDSAERFCILLDRELNHHREENELEVECGRGDPNFDTFEEENQHLLDGIRTALDAAEGEDGPLTSVGYFLNSGNAVRLQDGVVVS